MSDVNPQTLVYFKGDPNPICASEGLEELLLLLNEALDVNAPWVPSVLYDGRSAIFAPDSVSLVIPCSEKYKEEVLEEATNG